MNFSGTSHLAPPHHHFYPCFLTSSAITFCLMDLSLNVDAAIAELYGCLFKMSESMEMRRWGWDCEERKSKKIKFIIKLQIKLDVQPSDYGLRVWRIWRKKNLLIILLKRGRWRLWKCCRRRRRSRSSEPSFNCVYKVGALLGLFFFFLFVIIFHTLAYGVCVFFFICLTEIWCF